MSTKLTIGRVTILVIGMCCAGAFLWNLNQHVEPLFAQHDSVDEPERLFLPVIQAPGHSDHPTVKTTTPTKVPPTATATQTPVATASATPTPSPQPVDDVAASLGFSLTNRVANDALLLRYLGVEAVFVASRAVNTGELVLTGTLRIDSSGVITYESSPSDRLRAHMPDGQQLDFYISAIQGDFSSTATHFLGGAHHFQARIVTDPGEQVLRSRRQIAPRNADMQIQSLSVRTGSNSGDLFINAVGRMEADATPYDVNLTALGTYYFESSSGGLEQHQSYTTTGEIKSIPGAINALSLSVLERYANEHVVSNNVSVSTANTDIANTWSYNGISYGADNWQIRRSFRDGLPSQLDSYWRASGSLQQNGQTIGQLALDTTDGVYVRVVLRLADHTAELQRFRR